MTEYITVSIPKPDDVYTDEDIIYLRWSNIRDLEHSYVSLKYAEPITLPPPYHFLGAEAENV